MPHFREASWDEALDLVARRLTEIHAEHGPAAIAGFGSAKCSNEEAYLFQKLIRTGFGTNNVDHCTRLCHASQRRGAVRGHRLRRRLHDLRRHRERRRCDHRRAATRQQTTPSPRPSSSRRAGAAPRSSSSTLGPAKMADHADIFCQIKPGTDVALLQRGHARGHPPRPRRRRIRRDADQQLRGLAETVNDYPPETAAQISGVDADQIREFALIWGEARAGDHLLGHGHLAAHDGNRQRPLSNRHLRDHRQHRPARDRAAPAARAEQRAGCFGHGPDPDVLSGLPDSRTPRVHGRSRSLGHATWTRTGGSR